MAALDVINNDIKVFKEKKARLNINPDLEKDLHALDKVKAELNKIITEISSLNLRKNIIEEAEKDAKEQHFDQDLSQLKEIYQQASAFIPKMQHTFENLVNYHNQMQVNRIKYITNDLPSIDAKIDKLQSLAVDLQQNEIVLKTKISSSDTFSDLEELISQINQLYQQKGSYESVINSISEVEQNISSIKSKLTVIDSSLFSEDFQKQIDKKLSKFNLIFSDFSNQLYHEQYAIKCDVETDRQGKNIYKFAPIDINFSTGKKQGEISCFDLAYTKYADEEGIPCLHFLLNDKKELIHGNQLNIISKIAENENIQFVASILKDKLTAQMNNPANFVVELSQNDKLFRIEQYESLE